VPDTVEQQRARIQQLRAAGDFPAAYRYIATQVSDPSLQNWLLAAALINTPGDPSRNPLKLWVWRMNDAASRYVGNGPVSDARNQQTSDLLASRVIEDYLASLEPNGVPLTPNSVFQRDVAVAVEQLGIPEHLWAGGLLGVSYGFDIFEGPDEEGIFRTNGEAREWVDLAINVVEDNNLDLFNASNIVTGYWGMPFSRAERAEALALLAGSYLGARERLLAAGASPDVLASFDQLQSGAMGAMLGGESSYFGNNRSRSWDGLFRARPRGDLFRRQSYSPTLGVASGISFATGFQLGGAPQELPGIRVFVNDVANSVTIRHRIVFPDGRVLDARTNYSIVSTPSESFQATVDRARSQNLPFEIDVQILSPSGAVEATSRIRSDGSQSLHMQGAEVEQRILSDGRVLVTSEGSFLAQQFALVHSLTDIVKANNIANFAQLFGSTLGRQFGGEGLLSSTLSGALLGTIALNVGQAIAGVPVIRDGAVILSQNASDVWGNFQNELQGFTANAAIGALSSWMTMSLGEALGLEGFGAEMFSTGAGTLLNHTLQNIASHQAIFEGIVPEPQKWLNPEGGLTNAGVTALAREALI